MNFVVGFEAQAHLRPITGMQDFPFVHDPWDVWRGGAELVIAPVTKQDTAMHATRVAIQGFGGNLAQLAAAIQVVVMPYGDGPHTFFGVHTKSVLLRVFGRWAQIRGTQFLPLTGTPPPLVQDLFELVNYPAIVTKEERYAFSPTCINSLLGIAVTQSPTDSTWLLAQRFLP